MLKTCWSTKKPLFFAFQTTALASDLTSQMRTKIVGTSRRKGHTKCLWSGHASAKVFIEQALDKVLGLSWYRRPGKFFKAWVCSQHCTEDPWLRASPKWATPTQQNVCYDSNAPYVRLHGIRAVQHFRCNVVSTPNYVIQSLIYMKQTPSPNPISWTTTACASKQWNPKQSVNWVVSRVTHNSILECAKTENQCKQATIKKPLYPEVPGLTKSDKPKSMAFNWACSSLVLNKKFCSAWQLHSLLSLLHHHHDTFTHKKKSQKKKKKKKTRMQLGWRMKLRHTVHGL